MFTFFKKNTKKSSEQIIAEIHNEFDSASEKLLQEAKSLISGINTNKADRLKNLGFSIAKPVKETEQARQLKAKNDELAKKVSYFAQWYPHNKFITEEAVKAICEKYGLVFGDASYYKGDVPEKNVKEMESFVLRKEDMNRESELDWFSQALAFQLMSQSRGLRRNPLSSLVELTPSYPSYSDFEKSQKSDREPRYIKPPFKICAPESDFDMTKLSRKGHKVELNIPDPIVLQPVSGGYLIVTKWGLEASDELVVNEKGN